VDINTGEILAMVNSPSYNPNNFREVPVPKSFMRNRAITDIFEPGSIVKPMVVMAALDHGIVEKDSLIDTTPYQVNSHWIKDVSFYDRLTLTGILQKSSNVGVSRLALAMPPSVLLGTYSSFGLGLSTDLGLVGESTGLYPKGKYWPNIDRATFSFGYGLMATPVQLARVYSTIGSYGIYRPLAIIRTDTPVPGQRVMPESLVKTVVHMMESVALPGGAGAKAAVKDYRIAVKTGTVKKVNSHGKYINQYIAYTAGIAPVHHPQFALVTVINHPQSGKYYGGAVSAPVFSKIMRGTLRTMQIKEDASSSHEYTDKN
jgi:cell division protein FtsI (penicillin-binding protein 3)